MSRGRAMHSHALISVALVKRERKVERYALDSGLPREDSTVNE
jgi:hypothetical protein